MSTALKPRLSVAGNLLALLAAANPVLVSKGYVETDFVFSDAADRTADADDANTSQLTVSPGEGVAGQAKTVTYTRLTLADEVPAGTTLGYTLVDGDINSDGTLADASVLAAILNTVIFPAAADETVEVGIVSEFALDVAADQTTAPADGSTTTVKVKIADGALLFADTNELEVTIHWPAATGGGGTTPTDGKSMDDIAVTQMDGFTAS